MYLDNYEVTGRDIQKFTCSNLHGTIYDAPEGYDTFKSQFSEKLTALKKSRIL